MPQRLQLHPVTRRHPEGSVFVGEGSKWANPFRLVYEDLRWIVVDENDVDYEPWGRDEDDARAEALRLYTELRIPELGDLTELRGKDLACACDFPARTWMPDYCHATALLRAANGDQP